MPAVTVDDLEVQFPFKPYDVQTELMTRVVVCLRNRYNGLLESPTGTGKTLSLLCASLAWQRKQKSFMQHVVRQAQGDSSRLQNARGDLGPGNPNALFNVPKIIYSSRTHSQLSQAVQELRRSYYKDAKAVVLGSRDHMCVHEEVSRLESSSAKIMACLVRVHARSCNYYNNVSLKKEDPIVRSDTVVDIEDLVTKGKKNRFCPFFMSKELVQESDIVFMPYNYLLDPKLRASHGVDLKNSVIILDEGHNIAKICEEAVSFEIKNSVIAMCIAELTRGINEINETTEIVNTKDKDLSMGNLVQLKKAFLQLEANLESVTTTSEGVLLPASQLLSIFIESGFNLSILSRMINDLDAVSSFFTSRNAEATGCDKFSSIFRVLVSQSLFKNPEVFGQNYKVFVQYEETKKYKQDIRAFDTKSAKSPKVFRFWCFNPAVGLETMMLFGPRCILLSSGTLSPIPFLVKELQVPFPIQLSNPHIINDNQLFACVMKRGPQNVPLLSNFQNRNNPTYLKSLGQLIIQVCSVVPNGVLVFFPSYTVMETCFQEWQSNGIWQKISQTKKLFMEPKHKDAFNQVMTDYYSNAKTPGGACLMAVCRGKVSEGLDFTDENGRAVIITGIPYAPARDPQVLAKQQYLDQKCSKEGAAVINGRSWYQLEANRALNQAVGRIIRHAHDYGAILLCDERCDAVSFQDNLSQWVKQRMKKFSTFEESMSALAKFFGSSYQEARTQVRIQAKMAQMPTQLKPIRQPQASSISDGLNDTCGPVSWTEELHEMYRGSHVTEEFSRNRAPRPSKPEVLPQKSRIEAFAEMIATPVIRKAADFNAPVPVSTKSFNAFSQSSQKERNEPKRKKIRLVRPSPSSPPPEPKPSTLPPNSGMKHAAGPTHNSNDLPSIREFASSKEFWIWVKDSLQPKDLAVFASALKSYKKEKNISTFGSVVLSLFRGRFLFTQCCKGLIFILPDDHLQILKKRMSIP